MVKWIEKHKDTIIKLIVLALFIKAVLFNSIASAILVLCVVLLKEKPKEASKEPKRTEPKQKPKEPDKVAAGVSRKG